MSTLEILLSILTALSGLGNLAQWLNIKALRDKAGHEAESVEIENLKATINTIRDDYNDMRSAYREEIDRLKTENAELRAKIAELEEWKDEREAARKEADK